MRRSADDTLQTGGAERRRAGQTVVWSQQMKSTRAILALLAVAAPALADDLPLNPAVTQETIGETICVRSWTKTQRPPRAYTQRLKVDLIRHEGLPEELLVDFQLDHKIPLALGGAPADPRNFVLQSWDESGRQGPHRSLPRACRLLWQDQS